MIPKKILFCTDFSENSLPAGQCAAEYAAVFDAELSIVHVIDTWAGYPWYAEGVPQNILTVVKHLEELTKVKLEQVAKELGKDKGPLKSFLSTGVPAEEIVRVADQESIDLIVMGTHGWSGFRHMLLGSVAEKILRSATCPVLVVKSNEEGEAKD